MGEEANVNSILMNHQDLDIEVIPLSKLTNSEEKDSTYGSNEITDHSNFSLTTTTTHDSSGSNLCMTHNKFNPLDDPIIQEMFKQRTVKMDKVEEERRIRMYTMMRYSKKYKHLQTERANIKWDKSLRELDSQLSIPEIEDNLSETVAPKRTSSPNWLSNVSHRSLSMKQPSTNFGIDLRDLDLVDMELNNNHNSENNNEESSKPINNSNDSNLNDNDNEEVFPNEIAKVYSNSQDNSFDEITKSHSKTSNSSSENDVPIEDTSKQHPYKLTRSISNTKRRSLYEHENGSSFLNDSLSNSDFQNQLINNYMSSSTSDNNSICINTFNPTNSNEVHSFFSNNDIHSSSTVIAEENQQNKNKKKTHKKIKLFKIGHKQKNVISISDTNTNNKVSFCNGNFVENTSSDDNVTIVNQNTTNGNDEISNTLPSCQKSHEKKKKYYSLVRFFTKKNNKVIQI